MVQPSLTPVNMYRIGYFTMCANIYNFFSVKAFYCPYDMWWVYSIWVHNFPEFYAIESLLKVDEGYIGIIFLSLIHI